MRDRHFYFRPQKEGIVCFEVKAFLVVQVRFEIKFSLAKALSERGKLFSDTVTANDVASYLHSCVVCYVRTGMFFCPA